MHSFCHDKRFFVLCESTNVNSVHWLHCDYWTLTDRKNLSPYCDKLLLKSVLLVFKSVGQVALCLVTSMLPCSAFLFLFQYTIKYNTIILPASSIHAAMCNMFWYAFAEHEMYSDFWMNQPNSCAAHLPASNTVYSSHQAHCKHLSPKSQPSFHVQMLLKELPLPDLSLSEFLSGHWIPYWILDIYVSSLLYAAFPFSHSCI